MKYLVVALLGLMLSACTNDNGTRRALESQGFTDIQTHGYSVFGCGEDDDFSTSFTATNPKGQRAKGFQALSAVAC